ncbi:MAG TPA: D-glycerate dehydrogenase [Alphaproteobacteria bacterium]|nr:D-glycerate dehydrogenase [Alphaproteobacteria bacterium]
MDRPKILLTRRWPKSVEKHLTERYDVTFNETDKPLETSELRDAMLHFDAVCPTVSDRVGGDILNVIGRRAKILGNYGVGFNHIDIETCKKLGIVVTNTPDVLTDCTADLALTLMLMIARRAGEGERQLRARSWNGWRPTHLLGTKVTGKTLGLVGFGRIGQATAARAHHGFGMRIVYYSRHRAAPEVEQTTGATHCPDLDDLIRQSDFISLHCPGGPETRHLINEERIAKMKPGAFLINTARGEVVDETALVDALKHNRIAGAGLDVYEREPDVPNAMIALNNVVLLPHLGSATTETRVEMGMRVARNLDAYFDGKEPPDRVV